MEKTFKQSSENMRPTAYILTLRRQSQLQQKTNFATSFPIFEKNNMMFHENHLPADDSNEIPFLISYF